jgi:hypothetical protein
MAGERHVPRCRCVEGGAGSALVLLAALSVLLQLPRMPHSAGVVGVERANAHCPCCVQTADCMNQPPVAICWAGVLDLSA